MPICRLIRITCHKQEDNTGRDHPYIRVNGQRVWGPTGMEAEQTREIQRDVPFRHRAKVPKHGSWLNIAEIELSVLSRQCLCRRIGDQETLKREVRAWQDRRNEQRATVKWRFTIDDARIKLKRLYLSTND